MTIDDLLRTAGQHPWILLGYFLTPPALTWLTGRAHDTRLDGAKPPYGYVYATLIYLVSVPGMLAATLAAYGLFFLRTDLRAMPLLVHFLPIASMLGTWALMRRQVSLDDLPGFDRLSGLMLLLALCFGVAFLLHRVYFGVFFLGSLWGLAFIALGLFLGFRYALRRIGS